MARQAENRFVLSGSSRTQSILGLLLGIILSSERVSDSGLVGRLLLRLVLKLRIGCKFGLSRGSLQVIRSELGTQS